MPQDKIKGRREYSRGLLSVRRLEEGSGKHAQVHRCTAARGPWGVRKAPGLRRVFTSPRTQDSSYSPAPTRPPASAVAPRPPSLGSPGPVRGQVRRGQVHWAAGAPGPMGGRCVGSVREQVRRVCRGGADAPGPSGGRCVGSVGGQVRRGSGAPAPPRPQASFPRPGGSLGLGPADDGRCVRAGAGARAGGGRRAAPAQRDELIHLEPGAHVPA